MRCQRFDEKKTSPMLVAGIRRRDRDRTRKPLAPAVGDFDTQDGRPSPRPRQDESQQEVPAGYATVLDGIRGEFGNEQRGGVRGLVVVVPAPVGELLHGEPTGQARPAPGGAEALTEAVGALDELLRVNFLRHVTERGRRLLR